MKLKDKIIIYGIIFLFAIGVINILNKLNSSEIIKNISILWSKK